MQLSSTFTFAAILSIASAATSFGLVTIRSGSDLQYNSVSASGNNIVATTENTGITFVLNSDGSLVDAATKKYVGVNAEKQVVQLDNADKEFSFVDESNLAYKGQEVFAVASNKQLTIGEGTGVALLAVDKKETADVHPGSSSSSATKTSSSAPKPTSSRTGTKTSTATATSTATSGATTKFGVVSIASGTKFQYAAIKKVDSHPHVFSVGGNEGTDLVLTLKSDGTLVDQDGRGVNLDPKTGELGSVAPFGRQAATTGFAIKDGHLVHDGQDNWRACPSGEDKYSLANNDCIGGTGIALHTIDETKA